MREAARFDRARAFIWEEARITGAVVSASGLFDRDTVASLGDRVVGVLAQAVADPGARVSTLDCAPVTDAVIEQTQPAAPVLPAGDGALRARDAGALL